MTTTTNGARLNLDAPTADLYKIRFPGGNYYIDRRDNGTDSWPLAAAKRIACNVAMSNHTTVTLVKIEEPVTVESPYDHILHYVDTLKGLDLTTTLRTHNLPIGKDAVASKRERLIAHLLKCKDH